MRLVVTVYCACQSDIAMSHLKERLAFSNNGIKKNVFVVVVSFVLFLYLFVFPAGRTNQNKTGK